MTAGTAPGLTAATGRSAGPSRLVLLVRIGIVLVAVAAVLSPLYVALRGSAFLNQPPPPYWGVSAGTPPKTGGAAGGQAPASFGGC